MRSYNKFFSTFWTRGSGRKLRDNHRARLLAIYLMTNQQAEVYIIGIYNIAPPTIAHDLGISVDEVMVGLRDVESVGIAFYDNDEERVWIPALAEYQIGPVIAPKNHLRKHVVKLVNEVRDSRFLDAFLDRYAKSYGLERESFCTHSKPLRSPLQAHSKGSGQSGPSESESESESDAESDADRDPEREISSRCSSDLPCAQGTSDTDPHGEHTSESKAHDERDVVIPEAGKGAEHRKPKAVQVVFTHWQTVMGTQRAKLDPKREARIKARLAEGFTTEELSRAIDGAAQDPWIMGTDPKSRAGGYKGIETVLRDAAQVERFLALERDEDDEKIKACYFEAFEAHRGSKPAWGSDETKHVKVLLSKVEGNTDRACEAIEAYYADEWWEGKATIADVSSDPSRCLGRTRPSDRRPANAYRVQQSGIPGHLAEVLKREQAEAEAERLARGAATPDDGSEI